MEVPEASTDCSVISALGSLHGTDGHQENTKAQASGCHSDHATPFTPVSFLTNHGSMLNFFFLRFPSSPLPSGVHSIRC